MKGEQRPVINNVVKILSQGEHDFKKIESKNPSL